MIRALAACMASLAAAPAVGADDRPAALDAATHEGYAIASRADPQPTSDAPEDVLRRARNRRFDTYGGGGGSSIDEDSHGVGAHFCGPPIELPVRTSTTIVLANVSLAEAFLSQNQSQVYSEFTLEVDHVVKDDTSSAPEVQRLTPGATIHALRLGGALRLLSGRLVAYKVWTWPPPQAGESYVFFLTRLPDLEAFMIETAYLVEGATVRSLDGGPYPHIADKPLAEFLAEIAAAAGGPRRRSAAAVSPTGHAGR